MATPMKETDTMKTTGDITGTIVIAMKEVTTTIADGEMKEDGNKHVELKPEEKVWGNRWKV